jgi:hypothetical protein
LNSVSSVPSCLPLSYNEIKAIFKNNIFSRYHYSTEKKLNCPRHISSIIFKLRVNCWRTKFSEKVSCICSNPISVDHILFNCQYIKDQLAQKKLNFSNKQVEEILHDPKLCIPLAVIISNSNLYNVF